MRSKLNARSGFVVVFLYVILSVAASLFVAIFFGGISAEEGQRNLVFSLLHLLNVLGGGNMSILFVVIIGGTLWYVSRRVFNNLSVSIGLHALYDTAFLLLTGVYLVGDSLPDRVLDIQFGSFLILLVTSLLFPIFGRRLLGDHVAEGRQTKGDIEAVPSP